ncbi:MAG: YfcE family phosphodiesterase [Desulfuromonadaceae bacterium]|nr:YfcE family phosphodiesterase [Desulfuromonadaceae bacterium]
MFKIGVISDTHWGSLAQANTAVNKLLHSVFADVDAIIHAGDMLHPDVDMDLAFAPYEFYAVRGNMDEPCAQIPLKRMLKLCGVNIGVIHGWGSGSNIETNAASEFDLKNIDILIYGHSHSPACHVKNQTLFFNPGSATERRRAPYHSVGLIQIGATDPLSAAGQEGNKSELRPLKQKKTWEVQARQVLHLGAQKQVVAEIINIDAFSEIV